MSDRQWHLLSPVGKPARAVFEGAGRSGDLNGMTVGLLWNGKPGGEVLLDEVGRALSERFPALQTVKFWETRPATVTAYGMDSEDVRFVAANADLVIGGSAD